MGAPGLAGDLEVLTVAASTIRATGLVEFVVDLGHAGVTTSLLEGLPAAHVSGIVEALNLRDEREAVARAERAGLTGPALRALGSLPELHGGADLWERAERALGGTRALTAVRELKALVDAAEERSLAPRFIVDLAESRDFAYYTGAVFHVHARGPGQPIGAGGRYDSLYERFGSPRPAAGFALRLDDLRWALEAAQVLRGEPARVLVDGRLESLLAALRRQGVASAVAPGFRRGRLRPSVAFHPRGGAGGDRSGAPGCPPRRAPASSGRSGGPRPSRSRARLPRRRPESRESTKRTAAFEETAVPSRDQQRAPGSSRVRANECV